MRTTLIKLTQAAILGFAPLSSLPLPWRKTERSIRFQAPAEPNAIKLGTGGVENQPAQETWFRQ